MYQPGSVAGTFLSAVLNMEKRVYVCKSGLRLSYILYRTDPSDRSVLPAILYLHGADGRGDEIDTLLKIETLPSQILAGKHTFPENAVVIAPQCPAYENWSVIAEDVMDLMEYLIDSERLDRSRISLTGCSLGGMGTFSLGIRYPDFFPASCRSARASIPRHARSSYASPSGSSTVNWTREWAFPSWRRTA